MKYFPYIVHHSEDNNAQNNLFRIRINPKHTRYAAQLAQERYEFMFKWKILLAVTFPFLGLALLLYPAAAPLALIPGLIFIRLPFFRKHMELTGHTIESVVANRCYGDDLTTYMRKEANDLKSGYEWFNKESVEQVYMGMRRELGKSQRWVNSHLKTITKDYTK